MLNYPTHKTSCLDKNFCDCNVSLLFYIFTSVTGSDEAKRCRTDGCNWGYTRGYCCCWEFAAMSKVWIYSYEQLYYELLNVRSVHPIISVSQYGWDFGLLMYYISHAILETWSITVELWISFFHSIIFFYIDFNILGPLFVCIV